MSFLRTKMKMHESGRSTSGGWRPEKRKPADLDEHLAKILARGHERRASYEVAGVVNISFPVLNVQGHAIAGLTVPFVKRIEDTIGIPEVVSPARGEQKDIGGDRRDASVKPRSAGQPSFEARKKPRTRIGPQATRELPAPKSWPPPQCALRRGRGPSTGRFSLTNILFRE